MWHRKRVWQTYTFVVFCCWLCCQRLLFKREFVLFMLSSYMSSPFLVPCCDVCYEFREKRSSIRLYSYLFCRGSNFIEILFVFIYVYVCQTRFLCHMMFVAFNSNTTGVRYQSVHQKNDIQHNGQKKKDKQLPTKHLHEKIKNEQNEPTKNCCQLRCSGMVTVSSSCSTNDTRCITVERHEHHVT
jgi:hypothetical protein